MPSRPALCRNRWVITFATASGASASVRNAQGEEVSFAVMIQELERKRTAFAEGKDAQIHRTSAASAVESSDELVSSVK